MRSLVAFLLLSSLVMGQSDEQFKENAATLLKSLDNLGTGQLPEGFQAAENLAAVKNLRVQAAESQVESLQARFESGLDNINFLLQAQIELALALIDTTEDREEQANHIRAGLHSAILTWQRIKELQKAGVRGGDEAAEAQARQQVLRFYVWWHKHKAGVELGFTLADSRIETEDANSPSIHEPSRQAPVVCGQIVEWNCSQQWRIQCRSGGSNGIINCR